MNAVLSEKAQVTIPKPVREKLGLLPGAVLEFAAENGRKFLITCSKNGAAGVVFQKA